MAKCANSETPMMKQFNEMKLQHPDAILLFRCGDFYETYSSDAVKASEILGITLTKRANGGAQTTEMAGFPHHALDTYLPKLISTHTKKAEKRSGSEQSNGRVPSCTLFSFSDFAC